MKFKHLLSIPMVEESMRGRRLVLMRHPLSIPFYEKMYRDGNFECASAIQSRDRMTEGDLLLAFAGKSKPVTSSSVFQSVYEVEECFDIRTTRDMRRHVPAEWMELYPENFDRAAGRNPNYYYNLNKLDCWDDLEWHDRLDLDYKSARNFFRNDRGTIDDLDVVAFSSREAKMEWPGFDRLKLSYAEMENMIDNPVSFQSWREKLSSVGDVYLITLEQGGQRPNRHYVGAAYGRMGFWGRWSDYAVSGHGDNSILRELVNTNQGIEQNFQFSILWEMHISNNTKRNEKIALDYEKVFKDKLGSKATSLNGN